MGHTNSTVNYNLPQFVGTDKPSWLGDVNGAFLAIDTAIAAAKTEADSAAGGVAGLQTTVSGHTTQIGTLTDTVTAQGGTLNSVTALIGNGTPTTTDQTIIGAINEINSEVQSRNMGDIITASTAAWGSDTLVFPVTQSNNIMYELTACSTGNCVKSIYVCRSDNTLLRYDLQDATTASYSNGSLTITLPNSGYWNYHFVQLNSMH